MTKYSGSDIKLVCSSFRSCIERDGFTLEPKLGKICLSFFEIADSILIEIKRVSGNGIFCIKTDDEILRFKCLSKTSDIFKIKFYKNIEIFRSQDCIGEVHVFGITLEDNKALNSWKKHFTQCEPSDNIRLAGEKIIAAEGSEFSNASLIKAIETGPPNAFIIDKNKNKIIFLIKCEIKKIDFHSTHSDPQVLVQIIEDQTLNEISTMNEKESAQMEKNNPLYIYDSQVTDDFNRSRMQGINKNSLVKFVLSNNIEFLILKRGGEYIIPLSLLPDNADLTLIITGKKLNGNGRLYGGFCDSFSPGLLSPMAIDSELKDYLVRISSSNFGTDKRLKITMPSDSTGEVIISRIRLYYKEKEIIAVTPNSIVVNYTNNTEINNDKKFVIVIPSYKNSEWCEKNIQSTIDQNYDKYRVIFIDDCSPDDTFDKVLNVVNSSNKKNKFTLIKNTIRNGALCNLYNAIHSCDDDEIIVTLDGDDWLANSDVLNKLNEVYNSGDIWMTYGQYQNYPDNGIGISQQVPDHIINSNGYRQYAWCSSHLRTFYTWLFKQIKDEDLKYEGQFAPTAWDCTMQFPMLEMSGHHAKFIPDVLYIYNLINPINDHKVNRDFQKKLELYYRAQPRYNKLSEPKLKFKKIKIGLMMIATGKYDKFVQPLISSADHFFLNDDKFEVTYYLFTNKEVELNCNRNVVKINVEHRPFPFASMDRFNHFISNKEILQKESFLYYVDVDCLFVNHVTSEILGNLTAVKHCGFYGLAGPVESNPKSVLYVDEKYPKIYINYYGGGFNGGRTENFIQLAEWCYNKVEEDVAQGVIPLHHDETALNRYFLDNEPDVILPPSYHHPDSNISHYYAIWGGPKFQPILLLLTKDHSEIRS